MKKTIFQGIIFSFIIHILIIGFPIVQGYIAAKFSTPSRLGASENIHVLQNEVVFGFYYQSGEVLLPILSFLIGVGCFMFGKFIFLHFFRKS